MLDLQRKKILGCALLARRDVHKLEHEAAALHAQEWLDPRHHRCADGAAAAGMFKDGDGLLKRFRRVRQGTHCTAWTLHWAKTDVTILRRVMS